MYLPWTMIPPIFERMMWSSSEYILQKFLDFGGESEVFVYFYHLFLDLLPKFMWLLWCYKFKEDICCTVFFVKWHEWCQHAEQDLSARKNAIVKTFQMLFSWKLGPTTNIQLCTFVKQNAGSLQIWMHNCWF